MNDKLKIILLSIILLSLFILYYQVNKNIEFSKLPTYIPIKYQNEKGDVLVGSYDLSRESCKLVYETFNKNNQSLPLKALRECLLIGVG